MTYEPSEDLLERLASPHVQPSDVLEFLEGQAGGMENPPPVDLFFQAAMLDQYWRAREWWPKDVPAQWGCPSIYQLIVNYHEQDPRIGADFVERLTIASQPVLAWLEEQGRSVVDPEETPEQRKARLNAEAQARLRARRKGGPGSEHAEAVAAAYRAYIGICAARKQARVEWDARVSEARRNWEELKKTPPQ